MTVRTLPIPTADSEPFWRGCLEGQLFMQRCSDCDALNWFPRGICVNCSSTRLTWVQLSGDATVYSYSLVSRPPNDSFPNPYLLALVDLDEGPRMLTHLVDVAPADVRIGMAVTVQFERHSDQIALATFRPKR